jgi:rhamnosyltransferase
VIFPNRKNICAVFVTYHPDSTFRQRVENILPQVGGVVIVDNRSNAQEISLLHQICDGSEVTLVQNSANRGIAAALNQGVAEARARGFTWAISFDQDSLPTPDLVEGMLRVCDRLGEEVLSRVGILGSNYVDQNSGQTYFRGAEDGQGWSEQKTVITSGSLFSIRAYDEIGPFREEFFIDSVDHDYCLRARAKGYRVLLVLAPSLVHAMGNRRVRKLLPGMQVETLNYPAFRWYFMVRNRLTLAQEYATQEPAWALARAGKLAARCALTLVLESQRMQKARCMALGAFDFLAKRSGKVPYDLMHPATHG